MAVRVLVWVQHLLGIGHVRRTARIVAALVEAGFAVTVADGGFPVPGTDWGDARVVHLPPARATDVTFRTIVGADGVPIDASWKKRRAGETLALAQTVRPDVLIIETWPFGRRPFRFELQPLVEMAAQRRPRPLIVCSVRDVLVDKGDPLRAAEAADRVERLFDRVLVHGDPGLVPFGATFPLADRIADRIAYTGYVAPPRVEAVAEALVAVDGAAVGAGEVIVAAGGGAVGTPLFRAALAARAMTTMDDRVWRFLCGPDMPEGDIAAFRAMAPHGVIIEPARRDYPQLLARCALSISQAGYNTVMDLLRARCRAVVVPFAQGSETEQAVRAELLAARGVLTIVPEATLSPATLAAGISAALAAPPPPHALPLSLDGAATTARLVREMLGQASAHG